MGGALFNEEGIVIITNSTIAGNTAQGGQAGTGGFFQSQQNATDGAGYGGALFNHDGVVDITNNTIAGNTAAQGGTGVFNLADGSSNVDSASLLVDNSIVSGPSSPTALKVQAINDGTSNTTGAGNLITSQSGFAGTFSTSNPLLGSLAANGGPTQTMALLPGSPALGTGDPQLAVGTDGFTLPTDQRGNARTVNNAVDVGAFEHQLLLTFPGSQNGTEGSTSFNLGSFTDAGSTVGPWNVDVNWGDQTGDTTFTVTSPGSLGTQAHTYGEEGTSTVTVTVTDPLAESVPTTFQAHVADASLTAGTLTPPLATEG
jgi:hypothetical protein